MSFGGTFKSRNQNSAKDYPTITADQKHQKPLLPLAFKMLKVALLVELAQTLPSDERVCLLDLVSHLTIRSTFCFCLLKGRHVGKTTTWSSWLTHTCFVAPLSTQALHSFTNANTNRNRNHNSDNIKSRQITKAKQITKATPTDARLVLAATPGTRTPAAATTTAPTTT